MDPITLDQSAGHLVRVAMVPAGDGVTYWHIEPRNDRFYVVNQYGSFAGFHPDRDAALVQLRGYLANGDKAAPADLRDLTPIKTGTPDRLNNLGKPSRDYEAIYMVPGATDEHRNAVLVEVGHSTYNGGTFEVTVSLIGYDGWVTTRTIGRAAMSNGKVLDRGRYSRKKLDAFHAQVMADGVADLIPAEGPLRGAWDTLTAVAATEIAGA